MCLKHSCPRQNGVACLANFLYVSFFHAISNQNLKDILATKPTVKKNLRNVSANGLDFVIMWSVMFVRSLFCEHSQHLINIHVSLHDIWLTWISAFITRNFLSSAIYFFYSFFHSFPLFPKLILSNFFSKFQYRKKTSSYDTLLVHR